MRTWLRRVVLVLAGSAGVLGCGSDESGDQGDTGPIEQPCADYAAARCEAMERCASALFAYEFGTAASCQARLSAWCNHVGSLSGVRAGPKAIGSCATTFKDMSCEQWQSRRDDPLCSAPGGSLSAGAACVNGYQCSSKVCFLAADGVCGTCQTAPKMGEGCRQSMECPSGTTCIGYKCVKPAGVGEACDASTPCAGTLLCSGTCSMSPNDGEPCLDGLCNNKLATSCEADTCQGLTLADEGASCGGVVYCRGGGSCNQGTCKARVAVEHPCDANTGPYCLEPGVCVDGWCKVPDPSTCP